jgi:hypothetical protein
MAQEAEEYAQWTFLLTLTLHRFESTLTDQEHSLMPGSRRESRFGEHSAQNGREPGGPSVWLT